MPKRGKQKSDTPESRLTPVAAPVSYPALSECPQKIQDAVSACLVVVHDAGEKYMKLLKKMHGELVLLVRKKCCCESVVHMRHEALAAEKKLDQLVQDTIDNLEETKLHNANMQEDAVLYIERLSTVEKALDTQNKKTNQQLNKLSNLVRSNREAPVVDTHHQDVKKLERVVESQLQRILHQERQTAALAAAVKSLTQQANKKSVPQNPVSEEVYQRLLQDLRQSQMTDMSTAWQPFSLWASSP